MNKTLGVMTVVLSGVAVLLALQRQPFVRVDAGGLKVRMLIAGSGSPR
ncbi:MAG: hypothetical protein HY646_04310 [Acidobacteria bacterium]|nr:hypothetical protein [Acidobacteriota bacterium]